MSKVFFKIYFESLTHTLQTMQYLTHNHSLFSSYTRLESNNIKVLSRSTLYMVQVAWFYRTKESQMGESFWAEVGSDP